MNRELHDLRKSYEKGSVTLANMHEDPFHQFSLWFKDAETAIEVDEVNAMTLSTIGTDGFPRGRIVLLKEFTIDGFVFYTNYGSEKGQAIAKHPAVCISFFWPSLERQISIKGVAEKTSEAHSTAYFNKRPRESKLGALVSDQSELIKDREALDAKLSALKNEYENLDIPKADNWGGYLIKPTEFEFWQGRQSRLYDRIQYTKKEDVCIKKRLQP